LWSFIQYLRSADQRFIRRHQLKLGEIISPFRKATPETTRLGRQGNLAAFDRAKWALRHFQRWRSVRHMNLRWLLPIFVCHALAYPALAQPLPPDEIHLWPAGAPGKMPARSAATDNFIRTKAGKSAITDIAEPTLTPYLPEKPNGTAVIVAPGGGFAFLSAVHEGSQVCEWLRGLGVSAFLLKYRTPTRDDAQPWAKPTQDAREAVAMIRRRSSEWRVDAQRVGLLGFSAGGHLLAYAACARDWSGYPMNRDSTLAGVPDFGVMIYGGGFVDSQQPTKLKAGFTVAPDSPPMFIACAHDDGQNPAAAATLYLEYKKLGLPAELHLFTHGGHGFGMRDMRQPISAWPQRCAEWMDAMGWLPTAAKLRSEIQSHEQAMKEITVNLKSALRQCSNTDAGLVQEVTDLKARLAAAEAAGKTKEVAIYKAGLTESQKKLAELERMLKAEEQQAKFNPEVLVEEINRHKKAIAELQTQLAALEQPLMR
jgi:acetyl esterase/lipase